MIRYIAASGSAALALLILVGAALLGGCGDSDGQASLPRKRNAAIMPAWNQYDSGGAAEVRLWEDRDGGLWHVIGRADRFAVFLKAAPGADWTLIYATDRDMKMPAGVKLLVEPTK